MIKCVFPEILNGMSLRGISVNKIADVAGKSPDTIRKKLSGDRAFDIEEGISISTNLFPDVPFKELFKRVDEARRDAR